MPFKYNAARRHRIPKTRYRIQNWPAYEAGLKRRGDLTPWLDEAAYHQSQIRAALGFREATLDDVEALADWLDSQVPALEHRSDRLLVAAHERCRSLRIEPPFPGRPERLG